ncbi:hypothetical protein F5Y13DRAFT_12410 [Hypoxylon sp. FL1857]|nr:hypothetical protein F5Y13DRAFT_12410 [Hypoxylon sp. FL1857]
MSGNPRRLYQPGAARESEVDLIESLQSKILGDPNRKWGPFAKHVRAAKKAGNWGGEWSIKSVVDRQPYDSDDGEDNLVNQAKVKQVGRRSAGYQMTEELRQDVRPARIDFEALLRRRYHATDYDDDFYRLHYDTLYANTVAFATKWFDSNIGLSNIQGAQGSDQIWSMNLNTQFIEYARLVAHEDQGFSGWPATLNDPLHRRWLIVGILAQIMETQIFDKLLFGASEKVKNELDRQDFQFLDKEGYGRKSARATVAKYDLQRGLVPPEFWFEADELVAQSVKIFLPLLNVLKILRMPGSGDYSLECFTQELHNILSYAALIQVCMAISPSIFHVLPATPGARMDWSMETQADIQPYRESKGYWDQEEKRWREDVEDHLKGRPAPPRRFSRSNAQGDPLPYENRSGPSRIDNVRLPENDMERREMNYQRLRGAKVRYAVFPGITRFRPENVGKVPPKPTKTSYTEKEWEELRTDQEGHSANEIAKCRVVYYQGLINPPGGLFEGITLKEHLNGLPSTARNGLVGWLQSVIVGLFSWSRAIFWHVLVVSVIPLMLLSVYYGVDYFIFLYERFTIAILVVAVCSYLASKGLYNRYHTISSWLVICVPPLIGWIYGVIYTVGLGDEARTLWDVLSSRN